MKKSILTLTAALLFAIVVHAQDYGTGIGIRGGLSNGLTVKHFIAGDTALEGILVTRWQGFYIVGLYEIHRNLADIPGLHWYYGGGAHIGNWNGNDKHPWFNDNDSRAVIGIDGIIGVEYNFEIPLNLSLDWKPGFNLIGHSGLWGDEAALSIRYIF